MNDPFENVLDQWTVDSLKLWAEILETDLQNLGAQQGVSTDFLAELQTNFQLAPSTADAEQPALTIDVSGCAMDFGLNEIPQCILSIPPGRQADSISTVAPIHYLVDSLKMQIPVKVYAQVSATSGTQFETWPDGPFLIFDGITTHAGFRTSYGAAEFLLYLSHWLINLTFSSVLTTLSSPTNPVDISYLGAMRSSINAGAAFNFVSASQLALTMNSTAVSTDFWGYALSDGKKTTAGGLQAYLLDLANQNLFNSNSILLVDQPCLQGLTAGANTDAISALNRFEPIAPQTFSVPLSLNPGFDSAGISRTIAMEIAHETYHMIAQTTFWDKLVGLYAPHYQFCVVPLVNTALVVPFTPGLRQGDGALSWQVVYAREFGDFEWQATVPRPIRGVALLLDRVMMAGTIVTGNGQTPLSTGGALYDTCGPGVLIFKHGPAWLVNTTISNLETKNAVLANPVPTNFGFTSVPLVTVTPAQQSQRDSAWFAYAHSLYIQEVLRHRQARLSGRLRFDIAPGSSIAVEVPADKFVNAVISPDGDPDFLFGTVVRVSCMLNAEQQRAGTTIQVGFLRTSAEDQVDKTSIAAHPIWSQPWYGAPLVSFT